MTVLPKSAAIQSFSPNEPARLVGEWVDVGKEGLDRAVAAARYALPAWTESAAHDRARVLTEAADRVDRRIDELTDLVVEEVGRPIREARGEAQRVADTLRFYAQTALASDGELYPATNASSWVISRRR